MIRVRPYDDLAAHAVLSRLDLHDQIEAELVRGGGAGGLALFADWRAMRGAWVAGHVFLTRTGTPFAVGALVNTGQAGVAQAALLARDHALFRRPLAQLALRLSIELPAFCAAHGIHRVEARCWANHPTASRFLTAIGFDREADLSGFGGDGQAVFRQFVLLPRTPIDPHP
jgi:hypothetical protein